MAMAAAVALTGCAGPPKAVIMANLRAGLTSPQPIAVEPTGDACVLHTLNVVAHEDDDLLFINPAISDDLAAGRCVTTVFVTAGDAGRPRSYWQGREEGSMAAYAMASGLPNSWFADTDTVGGHQLTRYTLKPGRVELIFLRLPDAHGNATDRPALGLPHLWQGSLPTLATVDGSDAYTKDSLTALLTAVMEAEQPDDIRTLDFAGRYGDGDHADHHAAAYFTYAAQLGYHRAHHIIGYMGYEIANQPANLPDAARAKKLAIFLAYAAHDSRVCQTAAACQANFYAPRFTHTIVTADQAVEATP